MPRGLLTHGVLPCSSFPGPRGNVPVETLLKEADEIRSTKRVRDEGRDLVYTELWRKGEQHELWFDPAVNFLVRKYRLRSEAIKTSLIDVVMSYSEPSPGMFFPAIVKGEYYYKGKLSWRTTTTFNNLKVNELIPGDMRQLRFPPDIVVIDQTKNEIHRTDNSGEPTLPG